MQLFVSLVAIFYAAFYYYEGEYAKGTFFLALLTLVEAMEANKTIRDMNKKRKSPWEIG